MEAFGLYGCYYIAGANCNWWAACEPKAEVHREEWIVELPGGPQTGKWYQVGVDVAGDNISYYVDGKLYYEVSDNMHSSGGVSLFAYNAIAEFDNVVIKGDDIPDVRPVGYAVKPGTKLAITWGQVRK